MPLLELENVSVAYGRIDAVRNVSLTVEEGELVTLIGANGAGKTTTVKGVTGLQPVSGGVVRYEGDDVTGRPAFERQSMRIVLQSMNLNSTSPQLPRCVSAPKLPAKPPPVR